MARLESPDDHAPRPVTPPAWWWRADRGPTTAELRAHVLEVAGVPLAECSREGCPNDATPGYLLCAGCAARNGNV